MSLCVPFCAQKWIPVVMDQTSDGVHSRCLSISVFLLLLTTIAAFVLTSLIKDSNTHANIVCRSISFVLLSLLVRPSLVLMWCFLNCSLVALEVSFLPAAEIVIGETTNPQLPPIQAFIKNDKGFGVSDVEVFFRIVNYIPVDAEVGRYCGGDFTESTLTTAGVKSMCQAKTQGVLDFCDDVIIYFVCQV